MAKRRSRRASNSADPPTVSDGMRELIIAVRPDAMVRATVEGVASRAGADVKPIEQIVKKAKGRLRQLFEVPEDTLINERADLEAATSASVPDLSVYYQVQAEDGRLEELAEELREQDAIEAAYVKPPGEPPIAPTEVEDSPPRTTSASHAFDSVPAPTPDFTPRQIYLNAAPAGIDARFAWTLPGGSGAGVDIIDLEWGWNFNHEDLLANHGGIVGGTGSFRDDHGTAVIGEISGDRNSLGITGICPDARISAIAFSLPTAAAIRMAANRLRTGDIMLLEIHRAGPRFNFQPRDDQQGYIAVEWWPDDYDAIRYATSRGIIVVEAAGNGRQNLDDPIYSIRPTGFPSSWTNPFDRSNRDAGAILVGAGAPPPGTHGRNHGSDRSRLGFSNYGASVDSQAWGREVTSTGYADLLGRNSSGNPDPALKDQWYTDTFSGTSSASPIVVGALACVQGILRGRGSTLLTPATARNLLRTTGTPQQDTTGRPSSQRIGNRPDLRQMISSVTGGTPVRPSLRLVELQCHRTEDFFGGDETYLKVNGNSVWGPVSMRNGDAIDLTHLPHVRFRRRVRLDLYDQDIGGLDRDDHLGTAYAWASTASHGEQQLEFRGDGASYTLTVEVTA